MNANTKNISMKNGVVKSGEFSYTRQSRKLNAYGKEYEIPVRTVEFADKLDEIKENIGNTKRTSETMAEIKRGISLFIGKEETERLFPSEKFAELDVDELMGFWNALTVELGRTQNELLARYAAAKMIRQ